MPLSLVTDTDAILAWAAEKGFRVDRLIAPVAIGQARDGQLCGAVIYDNCNGVNAYAHVVSDGSRRWFDRKFLRLAFDYPFNILGVLRLTGLVDADNEDALRFDLHLGFVLEGTMQRAGGRGQDVHILRMFKHECRFL